MGGSRLHDVQNVFSDITQRRSRLVYGAERIMYCLPLMTVFYIRSQLSLETRIKKVVEQVKESGQQLLAELAIQHERGLVSVLKNIWSK